MLNLAIKCQNFLQEWLSMRKWNETVWSDQDQKKILTKTLLSNQLRQEMFLIFKLFKQTFKDN